MTRNPDLDLEPPGAPMRVAIVSADPLVRAGIAAALEHSGYGDSGDRAADIVDLEDADVAVWDLGADPGQVDDALEELGGVAMPVVVVSPTAETAPLALAAGARGIVLRDRVGPNLLVALAAARSGLTVLDSALAGQLVGDVDENMLDHDSAALVPGSGHDPDGRDALTTRELEVIELLAEGLSNRRIAGRLAISEHTVKFHVNGILNKLVADTRTEAVVEALRRGILAL